MDFEWPFVLFGLLLIPLLILSYWLAQRRRRAYAVRFTNLDLLSQVVGKGPGLKRHFPPLLFLLGLTALLVSVARPVAVLAMPREASNVILVLDVSGSMTANDLAPNRLEAAKRAARTFVRDLPVNISVGLVSFSNLTHLEAPLTRDRSVIVQAIDNLEAGGGTAIGDGLMQALRHIERQAQDAQGNPLPSVVVLLSDGESQDGLDPEIAATRAAEAGVRVETVGVGQRGAVVPLGGGQTAGLDEAALRAIAEATGGQYHYAAEAGQLEAIYTNLSSQVAWVEERSEVTALVGAVGALFLILGGLLALRWFQQFP